MRTFKIASFQTSKFQNAQKFVHTFSKTSGFDIIRFTKRIFYQISTFLVFLKIFLQCIRSPRVQIWSKCWHSHKKQKMIGNSPKALINNLKPLINHKNQKSTIINANKYIKSPNVPYIEFPWRRTFCFRNAVTNTTPTPHERKELRRLEVSGGTELNGGLLRNIIFSKRCPLQEADPYRKKPQKPEQNADFGVCGGLGRGAFLL